MTVTRRAKQHLLAIAGPAHRRVRTGMVSEALGLTARGWNYIHVDVAVVFSLKGDARTIRREDRIGFRASTGGEPDRIAAVPAHAP